MHLKRHSVLVLVLLLIAISAFYAGTRYQEHGPQLQFVPIAAAAEPAQPAALAAAGAPADLHSSRKLETNLLPLLVDTVAMPPSLGAHAGAGGGLAVVHDKVLIVDLRGSFFKAEGKGERIEPLPFPPLPNHAEEYAQFARKPIVIDGGFGVNAGFCVHDIEARREQANIRLFVSYERYLPELRTTSLVVSTIVIGADDFRPHGSWDDIYVGEPLRAQWYSGIAGGGRMVARGDTLYLAVGDYNQDNVFMSSRLEAQNPGSDFGKILKIDLRNRTKIVLSIGHRNPQGLVVTSSGPIYATEHGPRGGDELNRIVQGGNYGWPVTTQGTHYLTYDWPNSKAHGQARRFAAPVFAWVPSIAPSNLIEVSNFHPAWDGDLLVASLKARSLFRLRRNGDGHILYSEPILLGERLRDIGALPDGTLVLWTDAAQLMFVSIDKQKLATNRRPAQ